MSPTRWDDPWQRFPASKPIAVQGGLSTRRQRGSMAESWWSKRFVEVLESYGLGTRMQRGRRYARTGQVMSLDISPGLIAAQVQGSRRTPYLVTLTVAAPTARQWEGIDEVLRSRVALAANLLAGEVPPELEDAFADAGTPLFPRRWNDLRARCTCPDSANPCKHIAAVLYVFADRLDEDPWLALEWKGRTRDEVLAAVGLADVVAVDETPLPPWWPLRPAEGPPQDAAGAGLDASDVLPAEPDDVLRRLEDLDVLAWRAPVATHLPELYAALAVCPDSDEADP